MRIDSHLSHITLANTAGVKNSNISSPTTVFESSSARASAQEKDINIESSHTESTNAQSTRDSIQTNAVDKAQATTPSSQLKELSGNTNRITYGLKVIELMSDTEYQAFLWATQDLSESEKILMAQSLYRFTAFYQGKNAQKDDGIEQKSIDTRTLNAQRAFGIEHSMIEDFINRYKNAYNKLLQSRIENI